MCINDFFASAGDFIDRDDLDDQLEALAEISPSITGCLSDKQDSDRRSYYLGLKDVPPSIIDAQNNGSRARARKRAQQLNVLFSIRLSSRGNQINCLNKFESLSMLITVALIPHKN